MREVQPPCDKDLIEVSEGLLIQRLLKVKEEGKKHVRRPEPRRIERAKFDLVHLVEVGLCESDQSLSLLHDCIRRQFTA